MVFKRKRIIVRPRPGESTQEALNRGIEQAKQEASEAQARSSAKTSAALSEKGRATEAALSDITVTREDKTITTTPTTGDIGARRAIDILREAGSFRAGRKAITAAQAEEIRRAEQDQRFTTEKKVVTRAGTRDIRVEEPARPSERFPKTRPSPSERLPKTRPSTRPSLAPRFGFTITPERGVIDRPLPSEELGQVPGLVSSAELARRERKKARVKRFKGLAEKAKFKKADILPGIQLAGQTPFLAPVAFRPAREVLKVGVEQFDAGVDFLFRKGKTGFTEKELEEQRLAERQIIREKTRAKQKELTRTEMQEFQRLSREFNVSERALAVKGKAREGKFSKAQTAKFTELQGRVTAGELTAEEAKVKFTQFHERQVQEFGTAASLDVLQLNLNQLSREVRSEERVRTKQKELETGLGKELETAKVDKEIKKLRIRQEGQAGQGKAFLGRFGEAFGKATIGLVSGRTALGGAISAAEFKAEPKKKEAETLLVAGAVAQQFRRDPAGIVATAAGTAAGTAAVIGGIGKLQAKFGKTAGTFETRVIKVKTPTQDLAHFTTRGRGVVQGKALKFTARETTLKAKPLQTVRVGDDVLRIGSGRVGTLDVSGRLAGRKFSGTLAVVRKDISSVAKGKVAAGRDFGDILITQKGQVSPGTRGMVMGTLRVTAGKKTTLVPVRRVLTTRGVTPDFFFGAESIPPKGAKSLFDLLHPAILRGSKTVSVSTIQTADFGESFFGTFENPVSAFAPGTVPSPHAGITPAAPSVTPRPLVSTIPAPAPINVFTNLVHSFVRTETVQGTRLGLAGGLVQGFARGGTAGRAALESKGATRFRAGIDTKGLSRLSSKADFLGRFRAKSISQPSLGMGLGFVEPLTEQVPKVRVSPSTRTSSRSFSFGEPAPGRVPSPTPPVTPPVAPPPAIGLPFILPKFGGVGPRKKKKKKKKALKQEQLLTPTFTALALKLKPKKTRQKIFTGIELRAVPRVRL